VKVDDLLSTLADLVADRVLERLRAAQGDAGTYSSDALPPDCPSKARFHFVVKGIAGAERRGRKWFVPAEAWRAARLARKVDPSAPVARDDVDAAIEAAGFRPTRAYRQG
jgi:hypothetical protein